MSCNQPDHEENGFRQFSRSIKRNCTVENKNYNENYTTRPMSRITVDYLMGHFGQMNTRLVNTRELL